MAEAHGSGTSTHEKLVRMANQIAGFFVTQPGVDAAGETARHLVEFWDPSMRRQMADLLRADVGGLSDTAREGAVRACLPPEKSGLADGGVSPEFTADT